MGFAVHPPAYLGAFQQGRTLPLLLRCVGAAGEPADPDAPPTATVYCDATGTPVLVHAFPLAADERGVEAGSFRLPLFLGNLYATTGRYFAALRYATGGLAFCRLVFFHVLPGGSADGSAVAARYVRRPDAGYLIYQTDGGRLIRGRNPR